MYVYMRCVQISIQIRWEKLKQHNVFFMWNAIKIYAIPTRRIENT